MNKRHWLILTFGVMAMGPLLVMGTKRLNPPIVGPTVQNASGLSSFTVTDTVTPFWALLTSLVVLVLTGVFVYRGRKTTRR